MKNLSRPYLIRHSHLFAPDEYECSGCGATILKKERICPHCGASLKREKKDIGWLDEAEELSWMLEDD